MKKLTAFILAVTVLAFTGCQKTPTEDPSETTAPVVSETTVKEETPPEDLPLIQNGTFDLNANKWGTFFSGGFSSAPAVEDGELHLGITNTGSVEYGVQLYQDIIPLIKGGVYRCSFDMRSTEPRRFEFRLQKNGGDYVAYTGQWVEVGTEMQTYTVEFTMEHPTDEYARIVFNLGNTLDGKELPIHHIYIDNVVLELIDDSNMEVVEEIIAPDININQIGYKPNDKKIAVLRGENLSEDFRVINAENDEVVYAGTLSPYMENETADEFNYFADFSSVTKAGKYYIEHEKAGKSYTFEIGNDIYTDSFNKVLGMFYLQRCGEELTSDLAGDFAHAACHTGDATVYETGEKVDTTGGWHDAGDYGKYTVAGSKAAADLLLAYERNPKAFSDDSGIPESGNGIPDVLDETRTQIEWLLKMQAADGGVYHKVTVKEFSQTIMPDEEGEVFLSPVSSTATGDFAAVMAIAYKAYLDTDKEFAEKCLEASKKAWGYLEEHDVLVYKSIGAITTGAYGDSKDIDERYYAAAALLDVTGEQKYADAIVKYTEKKIDLEFGWQYVGSYGSAIILTSDNCKKMLPADTYKSIKDNFIAEADTFKEIADNDGYMISFLEDDYIWGSNMHIANNAMHLIYASDITGNSSYKDAAKNHLNYIFGVNPMGISYVTGTGTVSPRYPHHRPSQVKETAMPGMLVGGPDDDFEDEFVKLTLRGQPSAKCYADNAESYSTNEITIYWNSPLVFLMSEFK